MSNNGQPTVRTILLYAGGGMVMIAFMVFIFSFTI